MKKITLLFLGLFVTIHISQAQIGYQVSLLNSATGQPRANEKVKVKIDITNSDNTVICSEGKDATSNEFGVLSLSVGNDKTFEDVDWTKAPFFVSATIDGVLIGKSQILSVPIAEATKNLIGITSDIIKGTWVNRYEDDSEIQESLTFSPKDKYSGSLKWYRRSRNKTFTCSYDIIGNLIMVLWDDGYLTLLYYKDGCLYDDPHGKFTHQK